MAVIVTALLAIKDTIKVVRTVANVANICDSSLNLTLIAWGFYFYKFINFKNPSTNFCLILPPVNFSIFLNGKLTTNIILLAFIG